MIPTLNEVIVISDHDIHTDETYRVIACPQSPIDGVFIYKMKGGIRYQSSRTDSLLTDAGILDSRLKFIQNEEIRELTAYGRLKTVQISLAANFIQIKKPKNDRQEKLYARRKEIMAAFLDHQIVCKHLIKHSGFGQLVVEASQFHKCSRSTVYRLLDLFIQYGFCEQSLNLNFYQCGAPGVDRPVSESMKKAGRKTDVERISGTDPDPQRGVTEEDKIKIVSTYQSIENLNKKVDKSVYEEIIARVYVKKYVMRESGEIEPDFPPLGTYPNTRQIKRIIKFAIDKIERRIAKTTQGHFLANMRGLKGKSWQNIAGPGHRYVIDATIGDIYLRNSINRVWLVGRPIVYIVVDAWSTAIVGFYVCLSGPSWNDAKVALFSSFADPCLLAKLWGYQPTYALHPHPTVPYELLGDRGELLSVAGFATCKSFGINCKITPSYRPDLKGVVEVLHRIAKNEQYQFIPGAIDARREELALRTDMRESVLTVRSYAQYLASIFGNYNYFADRSKRIKSEMMGRNIHPSPAGLWTYGHAAGIGYRKHVPLPQLITGLLPNRKIVVKGNGVYLGDLQYEAPIVEQQQWTTYARNFGADEYDANRFPGTNSQIWVPRETGLQDFFLSPNARATPESTEDEWLDALMYSGLSNKKREHERLFASIKQLANTQSLVARERALTNEALIGDQGAKMSVSDARHMENNPGDTYPPELQQSPPPTGPESLAYEDLMNEVFELASLDGSNQ